MTTRDALDLQVPAQPAVHVIVYVFPYVYGFVYVYVYMYAHVGQQILFHRP